MSSGGARSITGWNPVWSAMSAGFPAFYRSFSNDSVLRKFPECDKTGRLLARAAAINTKVRFSSSACRQILKRMSIAANYTWNRYVQISVTAEFVHHGLLKDEEIA